jgi:signal transduction histidine kinase
VLTWSASKYWAASRQRLAAAVQQLRTRQTDLEQRLADAQALGQSGYDAARLAHSVKSTVHSLRGFASMIETRSLRDEHRLEAIAGMLLAIDRLEQLGSSVLGASTGLRGASDAAQIERTLAEVVRQVGAQHGAIRWSLTSAAAGVDALLSPAALHDVLLVLAENAAEACAPSGHVEVDVQADAHQVHFVVSDDGPGLTPLLRTTLFRLGATSKPSGHGLGLFLVRRVVEACGGQVRAAVRTPRGTVVQVSVPRADAVRTEVSREIGAHAQQHLGCG